MFGEAQQPLRSSARSPELDLDSLSVRSDDSGESSWTDMGDSISVATEGDASIGEGLFRVERDDDNRLGGVSPCLEVAEEVMGDGSLADNEPTERLVSVLTIHLGRLAAAQVSGAGTSSLLLTADSVGITEADVQDYAHFQFRCAGASFLEHFLKLTLQVWSVWQSVVRDHIAQSVNSCNCFAP